ncbi:MAG TPA: HAD-IA family hydrolase, partial [Deltaproteobacteria bacterium]|nr:HAD-IA family hydrolase [Deltaproteobacteria bacterium]
TLYPRGTGPFSRVNLNIDRYVMRVCGVDQEGARAIRRAYIGRHGSTLLGLMRDHGVDPTHYLAEVHDVPVEDMLCRDERLRKSLASIAYPIVVFTNGSYAYACRVVSALGVADIVGDLFTIEYMDFIPKPKPWGFRKAMRQYGKEPCECLVVDDSAANVETAFRLGMHAVIVGGEDPHGHAVGIPSIYDLSGVVGRMTARSQERGG